MKWVWSDYVIVDMSYCLFIYFLIYKKSFITDGTHITFRVIYW